MNELKECSKCKQKKLKTEDYFYKKRNKLESYCKECRKKMWKKHYYNNLESERKRSRDRKRNRNEKQLERSRKLAREWSKTPNGIYKVYRRNAKKRKIIFDLDRNTFTKLINKKCEYCGNKSKGVDRVDNSKGYIKSNCVSCCDICNRMKMMMTKNDFIKRCKLVANNVPFPSMEELMR